jgi:hypothetical protein
LTVPKSFPLEQTLLAVSPTGRASQALLGFFWLQKKWGIFKTKQKRAVPRSFSF